MVREGKLGFKPRTWGTKKDIIINELSRESFDYNWFIQNIGSIQNISQSLIYHACPPRPPPPLITIWVMIAQMVT